MISTFQEPKKTKKKKNKKTKQQNLQAPLHLK